MRKIKIDLNIIKGKDKKYSVSAGDFCKFSAEFESFGLESITEILSKKFKDYGGKNE